jgi:tyrosyl-tRNA synthetase
MQQQHMNPSLRTAQHLLAKELVELAHGAKEAKEAEAAHKESFSLGTGNFSLLALRSLMEKPSVEPKIEAGLGSTNFKPSLKDKAASLALYRREYASTNGSNDSRPGLAEAIVIPRTLLGPGSFAQVLVAANMASSKKEARRMIATKSIYVVDPSSGTIAAPTVLRWERVSDQSRTLDPTEYLIDWEALVLRHGKSKIKVCRVISEKSFEAEGLTCPGWEEFKRMRAEKQQFAQEHTSSAAPAEGLEDNSGKESNV